MIRRNKDNGIVMTEGDYGLNLPITIKGGEMYKTDKVTFIIKENSNENVIFTKNFTDIENNTFNFVLSKEDSNKLPVGVYVYSLDWTRGEDFLCNLIEKGLFVVEDKI